MKIADHRDELMACWRNDGDALPLVRYLLENDDLYAVSVVCQLALETEEDSDRRAELERIYAETGYPPDTWDAALIELANKPSVEAWEELFQWVPLDAVYHRAKTSIHRLRQLGVDPDILFRCACLWGTSPSAMELADTGAASPEVILERGKGEVTEPAYVALAAHSAAARGDMSRAVWLGNQALSMGGDFTVRTLVDLHLADVAELLDEDHRPLLRFGTPDTE